MSHFMVLVIGEDIEGQMAPYDENLEVAPYWTLKYDPSVPGAADQFEARETREWLDSRALPADGGSESTPESYAPTAEQVLAAWKAKGWLDDDEPLKVEDGKLWYQTTYNEDSKWDWYSLGGRWTGFWKLNAEGIKVLDILGRVRAGGGTLAASDEYNELLDTAPTLGEPGLMTPRSEPGRVDSALKRHIDLAGMRTEKEAEAREEWARYAAVLGPVIAEYGIGESWGAVYERVVGKSIVSPGRPDEDLIDAARKAYRDQPYARAIAADSDFRWVRHPHEYFGPDLSEASEAAFIQRASERAYSPYAVVRNGEWRAKGDMGWFGMSSDKVAQSDWNAIISTLIDALDPNERLTILDCHI